MTIGKCKRTCHGLSSRREITPNIRLRLDDVQPTRHLNTLDLNRPGLLNPTLLIIHHLFSINIPPLNILHPPGSLLRLPSRRTNIPQPIRIVKDQLHLLQRLARRLRKHKSNMQQHRQIKNPKDDIHLPPNRRKSLRHKRAERAVESPIRRSRQRHCFTPNSQRIDLRRVHPGHGAPGDGVAGDEQVGARDEGFGGRPSDSHGLLGHVVEAAGDDFAGAAHDACVGEHEGHHEEGAEHQGPAAAPFVHPDEGGDRHDYVYYVLDRGGEEVGVAGVAGHSEDVGDLLGKGRLSVTR
jgi:hypothetical protein